VGCAGAYWLLNNVYGDVQGPLPTRLVVFRGSAKILEHIFVRLLGDVGGGPGLGGTKLARESSNIFFPRPTPPGGFSIPRPICVHFPRPSQKLTVKSADRNSFIGVQFSQKQHTFGPTQIWTIACWGTPRTGVSKVAGGNLVSVLRHPQRHLMLSFHSSSGGPWGGGTWRPAFSSGHRPGWGGGGTEWLGDFLDGLPSSHPDGISGSVAIAAGTRTTFLDAQFPKILYHGKGTPCPAGNNIKNEIPLRPIQCVYREIYYKFILIYKPYLFTLALQFYAIFSRQSVSARGPVSSFY